MARIKVFISYSTDDCNKKADIIKDILHKYLGFDSFIAHSDISVGKDFNSTIIKQIKECHLFIPLISQSAITSPFVNQEIGLAIGACKPIIPIKVNANPFGFISPIQALKFPELSTRSDNITLRYVALSSRIYFPLFQDKLLDLQEILFGSLLFALSKSPSLFTANVVGRIVANSLLLERFNNRYDQIIRDIVNGNQYAAHESFSIPSLLSMLSCR